MLVPVTDPLDPRLADYRELKERRLTDRFVAESEVVVRKLLTSGLTVHSVLVTPPRLAALEVVLPPELPVYVVQQSVMDALTGFHIHRGCLAVASRPVGVRIPEEGRTLVVLEDLVDVDNVGTTVRNARAFGASAVLLSPRCADPYYRKAVRTSAGCVFDLPIVRLARWPEDLLALKPRFRLAGMSLREGAVPLATYERPTRLAIVLGTEGTGLSDVAHAACDDLLTIPMASGADSLNVSAAGAVALYALR